MCIAEVNKVGNGAFRVQQSIERHGGRGFDEVARRDENQLTAEFQMVQAAFDEEQIEIGPAVEHGIACQVPCIG